MAASDQPLGPERSRPADVRRRVDALGMTVTAALQRAVDLSSPKLRDQGVQFIVPPWVREDIGPKFLGVDLSADPESPNDEVILTGPHGCVWIVNLAPRAT